jgi:hypothetical protein
MRLNNKTKHLLICTGAILSLAVVINFYLFLFAAWASSSWSVTIYFNRYNEALVEIIMYLVILPFIIISASLIILQTITTIRSPQKRKEGYNVQLAHALEDSHYSYEYDKYREQQQKKQQHKKR